MDDTESTLIIYYCISQITLQVISFVEFYNTNLLDCTPKVVAVDFLTLYKQTFDLTLYNNLLDGPGLIY